MKPGLDMGSAAPQEVEAHVLTLKDFVQRMGNDVASPDAAFNKLDTRQDGYLTLDEFEAESAAFRPPLTHQEATIAVLGFDENGDERIAIEEFSQAIKARRFHALGTFAETSTQPASHASMSMSLTTTAEKEMFELQDAPIDVESFSRRMGLSMPRAFAALNATQGCVDLETFRRAAKEFQPPLSRSEVDYAFCGMDANHDRKVCSLEFFGTIKVGHFFPLRSSLDYVKELQKVTWKVLSVTSSTSAAPKLQSPGHPVPMAELRRYHGVPAIVNGRAEISLRLRSPAVEPGKDALKEISDLFSHALGQDLGLDVNVVDVESVQVEDTGRKTSHLRDKTIMILWTAGSVDDGGALQLKLHRKSAVLEAHVKDVIAQKEFSWLGHAIVWAKISLNFYGPRASSLPAGQKIWQDIGRKSGLDSKNGSPAYVLA